MKPVLFSLLLALGPVAAFAQPTPPARAAVATRTISGRVTDAQGQGLPGVAVLVQGTALGTRTAANGAYTLAGVPARGQLLFSCVGYATRELAPPPAGQRLNVVLLTDHQTLREVAVAKTGRAARRQRHPVRSG